MVHWYACYTRHSIGVRGVRAILGEQSDRYAWRAICLAARYLVDIIDLVLRYPAGDPGSWRFAPIRRWATIAPVAAGVPSLRVADYSQAGSLCQSRSRMRQEVRNCWRRSWRRRTHMHEARFCASCGIQRRGPHHIYDRLADHNCHNEIGPGLNSTTLRGYSTGDDAAVC